MGIVGKLFAIVMFPLSILIVLEKLGLYTLALPIDIDKVLIGAALMIALQVITLIMLKISNEKLTFMNIITGLIFIATAVAAVLSMQYGSYTKEAPIVLAVMMFVEALYALH